MTISAKKFHHSFPTGFQMRIWLEVLWMWEAGWLEVHGIPSRRQVCKETVKVRSNYKKSYFCWFGNPVCGDSTESNRIEKSQGRVSARLVLGKREKGAVWFSLCRAPSDDWINDDYIDVLFTCGGSDFGSLGSWYFHTT